MNLTELRPALRAAGVDDGAYRLEGESRRPSPDYDEGVRLVEVLGSWEVVGGAEVTYGFSTTLRTFDSEEEACEVFYREMTRPDGAPFAAEKAAWKAERERHWKEEEEAAAREWPTRGPVRAYWRRVWAEREAAGQPAMTVRELREVLRDPELRLGGRWHFGGFDEALGRSWGDEQQIAAPLPDGTWWLAWTGERGSGPFFTAVGLSEAEACKYIFDHATRTRANTRPTEAQWRAEIEASRWNAENRPLPPWPRPTP
ncbi:hypothetical protein [Streptomyces beihaiensis]|uniref:Uncharacterized protein n=1 Tax=Streptomyces beihaiensis TaxID=2984495 RepID=A0ABT3TPA0_9ACTN|nr:hypothetical protein [Streptomyces beihaiensis]MCX3058841.1 hypothetical protein [Streptomyces beihaiensis]